MISYRNISIQRNGVTIVHNASLNIGEGEFVYLLGRVGSGKSSLMKSFYKEMQISGDEANIFGQFDLLHMSNSKIPYLRRKIGIIFQDFQLLTDRTVYDNLDFVLRATGWKKVADRAQRIDEVLKLVEMDGCGNRMPNTLSGGEQQRIVIARALLNNPKLILADEPTGNLDPLTGRNIVKLLYDICHDSNATVVMCTHNMSHIKHYPGRMFQMVDGVLEEIIKEKPVVEENPEEENPEEENPEEENPEEDTESEKSLAETELEEPLSESEPTSSIVENTEAVAEETQTDSSPSDSDNSNDEDRCSQSATPPVE